MRIAKLAFSLLLVGLSSAHPQYPSGGGAGADVIIDITTGCPDYTHDCVPFYQCIDGEINTSGAGLIDVRIKPQKECTNAEFPEVPGLCCRIPGATLPPTPAPIVTCPAGLECVEGLQCNPDGNINTDGAGLFDQRVHLTCTLPGPNPKGVCCRPPPPPALDACYGNEVCLTSEECAAGTAVGGASGSTYEVCFIDKVNYVTGVCCLPPPPPPLDVCYNNQVCLPEGHCTAGTAVEGTSVNYDVCFIDKANYVTGTCCDPPIRVIDVCPSDSVCLPEILCQGDILTDVNSFVSYANADTWSQCALSGDIQSPGVCCRNPVVPGPVYNPANKCGVRNYGLDVRSQVLNKNEAQFGEFPWQAVLFFSNFTFKCGASLVADRWLVTGAHCVSGYQYGDFKIRLGEWRVDTYDEPLPYVDVDIASIAIHPGFNPTNLHNDVAVLELTAPVPLQYHINTVCLPSPGQLPIAGTRCFASGWGKDAFEGAYQAILKKVDVPFVEHKYCQDLLRYTRLGKYFQLDQSFICAGGEENQDACTGDGGGPLVCEDPTTGAYYLQGITAWGINCGEIDVPGVYADVQYFADWISNAIYGTPVAEVTASHSPYGRK